MSNNKSDQASVLKDFVFHIPYEKFVFRKGGKWCLDSPVGKEALRAFLIDSGCTSKAATRLLKECQFVVTHGDDIVPNQPELVSVGGRRMLNLWIASDLSPKAGEYPRIERLLQWLTAGDEQAQTWICHWLALKLQNPEIVPKVAVMFTTEPGGGKGTLARLFMEMLGRENCAKIERVGLESRFNKRWARKLFVFADEVVTKENFKDISERLKILIDSDEIELEGKGTNQIAVRSRLAWMFASNDYISPINIERGDRRYAVFSNHAPVTPEHKAFLDGMFEEDRVSLTEETRREVAAFMHDLLAIEVDRNLVSRPYQNAARDELIKASMPSHLSFVERVKEEGIDGLIEDVIAEDYQLTKNKELWDFKARGIATQVIYRCYEKFCKSTGQRPLGQNKLGVVLKKYWKGERVAFGKHRIPVYQVPRRSEVLGIKVVANEVEGAAQKAAGVE